MKSKVFTNAWQLVKTMGLSLSMALTIAWQEAKVDKLSNDYAVSQGIAFNYKNTQAIEIELALQVRKLNQIKPCHVNFAKPQDSGAAFYYGCGHYNGD